MILMKYTKQDGAEYISHIDTLRHIGRTLTRAKIDCSYSKGFNPHKNINLSSPLPLGLKSNSEYCVIDTTEPADSFMQKFNEFSPKGIKCIRAIYTEKKVNVADLIDGAEYQISGAEDFNEQAFMLCKEKIIEDKRGKQFNVYDRIKCLFKRDNQLIAHLNFGRNNFRIEDFLNAIGYSNAEVIKTAGLIGQDNADKVFFK